MAAAQNGETAIAVLNNLVDTGLLKRQGTTMAAVVPSLADHLANELDRSLALGGVAAHKLAEALKIK